MAYGLRAKIAPGVELHDIHIHLAVDRPPEVRLEGVVRHAKTARIIGTTTIKTVVLGPAGVAFINELKDAFGAYVAANGPVKEPNERYSAAALGRGEHPHGQ